MTRVVLSWLPLLAALAFWGSGAYFVTKADWEKQQYLPGPGQGRTERVIQFAPNNVAGLLASGSGIACGLALVAAAIANNRSRPAVGLPPGRLQLVLLGALVLLVYTGLGTAFKDSVAFSSPAGSETRAFTPNNVDGLAAFGFLVAAGLSLVALALAAPERQSPAGSTIVKRDCQ